MILMTSPGKEQEFTFGNIERNDAIAVMFCNNIHFLLVRRHSIKMVKESSVWLAHFLLVPGEGSQ